MSVRVGVGIRIDAVGEFLGYWASAASQGADLIHEKHFDPLLDLGSEFRLIKPYGKP